MSRAQALLYTAWILMAGMNLGGAILSSLFLRDEERLWLLSR